MGCMWPCSTLLQSSVSWEFTFDPALRWTLSKEILFFLSRALVCVCVLQDLALNSLSAVFRYLKTKVAMIVTFLIYEVSLGPLCCLRRLDDCRWQCVLTVNSDKWKWSWPVFCRLVTNICMKGKKDLNRDNRRFRHGICRFWNRKQGCQWLGLQFYGWRSLPLSGVQFIYLFFLPRWVSRLCRSFTAVVFFTWYLLLMHVFPLNVWLVVECDS
jgi:hypothetical protein